MRKILLTVHHSQMAAPRIGVPPSDARNIPSAVCVAPSEDEQVML
jgi:hypothetical protein